MQPIDDNPELYQEATKALETWCAKNNTVFDFPSSQNSEIGRKYVYLRNANGLLAKYDIKGKKILVGE